MTTVVQVIIRVILGVKGFIAARPGLPAGILSAAAALIARVDAMRALGQAQTFGGVVNYDVAICDRLQRATNDPAAHQPLGFIAADAFADQPSRALEFRMTAALTRAKERFLAQGRAILEAARRAGIRITLLDTCYLHGGIDHRHLVGRC